MTPPSFQLTSAEQDFLLELARNSIRDNLQNNKSNKVAYFSDRLKKNLGVFVTLHKHGDLRGCIGYVEGIKPLQDAVIDMANAAAFDDPRFEQLKMDELEDIKIEISVLSPLVSITDTEQIEIGKHGIIIEKGYYSGLLLPQVATEYNLDRKTFLEHTCIKAGLPKEVWKDKETVIKIFSAHIFSE